MRHLISKAIPGYLFVFASQFLPVTGGLGTPAKRLSALAGWMPWKRLPLTPDGTISANDRQALVTMYRGEA